MSKEKDKGILEELDLWDTLVGLSFFVGIYVIGLCVFSFIGG
jgi:hypothetical protein